MKTRKLGPFLATMFVTGNIIGTGMFLLPASMGTIGGVSLLAWLCAVAGALLLAGVFARLGVLAPWAGGPVAFSEATLGRYLGFQAGYIYWLSCWIGNVGIALGVTGYLTTFLPDLAGPLFSTCATVVVIWIATLVNIAGARMVGKAETFALVVGLIPIMVVLVFGWWWFDPAVFAASWNVTGKPILEVVPPAVILVFWAFLGLETAAVAADVVERPERNLPIAALGGVALSALVYVAVCTVPMGIVPARELAASPAPLSLVTEHLFGSALGRLVSLAAIIKAAGTLFGWCLVTVATAKAAAGKGFFPPIFARTDNRGVPVESLLIHGVLMSMVALATMSPTLGEQFARLADVAVVFTLVIYVYSALALLRLSKAEGAQRWRDRGLALGAIVFSAWAVLSSNRDLLLVAAVIIATSLPVYQLSEARRRARAAA